MAKTSQARIYYLKEYAKRQQMSDQNPPSRRPKEIPEDTWYDMDENEKMLMIKKYNPTLYAQLLAEEAAYGGAGAEEEYVSRRPKEISEEAWDAMEEEQKMEAVKKYNPEMYNKLMAEAAYGGAGAEEEYVSRRPKEISEEAWDAMEEEQKMEAVKKYNPEMYKKLMAEAEAVGAGEEEEYVSRRPKEVPQERWDAMEEEEKLQVIEKYSKPQESAPRLARPAFSGIPDKKETAQVINVKQPVMKLQTTSKPNLAVKNIEQSLGKSSRGGDLATKYAHYQEDEEEDDEPQTSVFKITNLISLFTKHDIKIQSIFVRRRRIKFLIVTVQNFTIGLHMPAKYEMYMERPLGIGTYELVEDDEEDDQDTLFYNKLPIESLRREKISKIKSLHRFLPLITESEIKIMNVSKYFIVYIDQQNTVQNFILSNPIGETGYYYLMDLQFLFKNLNKVNDDLVKFEKAFNDAVYDRLSTEVQNTKVNLKKVAKRVYELKPLDEKKLFNEKLTKIMKYVKIDKHREKANKVLAEVRSKNLNAMFDMENVTYVLREFK